MSFAERCVRFAMFTWLKVNCLTRLDANGINSQQPGHLLGVLAGKGFAGWQGWDDGDELVNAALGRVMGTDASNLAARVCVWPARSCLGEKAMIIHKAVCFG